MVAVIPAGQPGSGRLRSLFEEQIPARQPGSGRIPARQPGSGRIPARQPGSGRLWSLFQEQALVVLVHDMGPNWELVSDAINSTLQFKCKYRKPNECKKHHKLLMDRTSVDGADSAEDSGSSQTYPTTLPGIPEGSARQLCQRLHGPIEEDMLKSHFEKIILIGKKYLLRKTQLNNISGGGTFSWKTTE